MAWTKTQEDKFGRLLSDEEVQKHLKDYSGDSPWTRSAIEAGVEGRWIVAVERKDGEIGWAIHPDVDPLKLQAVLATHGTVLSKGET